MARIITVRAILPPGLAGLPTQTIKAALTGQDRTAAVDALIAATLDAGAPDNVTVIVIDPEAS